MKLNKAACELERLLCSKILAFSLCCIINLIFRSSLSTHEFCGFMNETKIKASQIFGQRNFCSLNKYERIIAIHRGVFVCGCVGRWRGAQLQARVHRKVHTRRSSNSRTRKINKRGEFFGWIRFGCAGACKLFHRWQKAAQA